MDKIRGEKSCVGEVSIFPYLCGCKHFRKSFPRVIISEKMTYLFKNNVSLEMGTALNL